MKCELVLLLLLVSFGFEFGYASWRRAKKYKVYHHVEPTNDTEKDYKTFLTKFYPHYNSSDRHHQRRRQKFDKCREDMMKWDPDTHGYAIGITQFCHWTDEEFTGSLNSRLATDTPITTSQSDDQEAAAAAAVATDATNNAAVRRRRSIPASFDWRDRGAVSSVKDQEKCGDCYTFAAAAALESAYFIRYGKLYNLSTQHYTDCTVGYTVSTRTVFKGSSVTKYDVWSQTKGSGNQGCNGGNPRACWFYNNATGPVQSWECYPFTSGKSRTHGTCAATSSQCSIQVRASNYVSVEVNSETALLDAVLVNPVACGMDANTLQNYVGGVFNGAGCTSRINHAVTVVGYGTEEGLDYWLIKNSWGPTWGADGYFKLIRGRNACGIASSCAYPIVGAPMPADIQLGMDRASGASSTAATLHPPSTVSLFATLIALPILVISDRYRF